MAELHLTVRVKRTPAFTLMLELRDDIEQLIAMVPDHLGHELQPILDDMNDKWKQMAELCEIERGEQWPGK